MQRVRDLEQIGSGEDAATYFRVSAHAVANTMVRVLCRPSGLDGESGLGGRGRLCGRSSRRVSSRRQRGGHSRLSDECSTVLTILPIEVNFLARRPSITPHKIPVDHEKHVVWRLRGADAMTFS